MVENLGSAISEGTNLSGNWGNPLSQGLGLRQRNVLLEAQQEAQRQAKEQAQIEKVAKYSSMDNSKWFSTKRAKEFQQEANTVLPQIMEARKSGDVMKAVELENGLKNKLAISKIIDRDEEKLSKLDPRSVTTRQAQDIYNTNQELFEGVGESGGVGFGVGFLLNAMGANAKLLRSQGKKDEADMVENQMKSFETQAANGGPSSYKLNGIKIESPEVINNLIDNMNAAAFL